MLLGSCIFAILAMFLSASGWSILLRAMTVGNFSSVKAFTTRSIVSSIFQKTICQRNIVRGRVWNYREKKFCHTAPVFERLFETQLVERARHHGGCTPVAAELRLESFYSSSLDGDVSPLDRAPFGHQVASYPGDDLGS